MLEQLIGYPTRSWRTSQAIVLDWCDGPQSGFCRLGEPTVDFYFALVAERSRIDSLDDRLFRLNAIPEGTFIDFFDRFRCMGPATSPVWCPIFAHDNHEYLVDLRRRIASAIAKSMASHVIVYTRDMVEFLGCWVVHEETVDGEMDWFKYLGLVQPDDQ